MKKAIIYILTIILIIFISDYILLIDNNKLLYKIDVLNRVLLNPYWLTKDLSEVFDNKKLRSISKIKIIVVHHDSIPATNNNRILDIHSYHISRNLGGFAYHFYIMPSGKIYKLYDIDRITSHCKGYNTQSISICLNGNFEEENPTTMQYFSYWVLSKYLKNKYNLNIFRHGELNDTKCCGKKFNIDLNNNKNHILQWIL